MCENYINLCLMMSFFSFVGNIQESWEIQSGEESSSSSFSFACIPFLETLLSENELRFSGSISW